RPLRGLIAPHIDFERGGKVYGSAYRKLYESGKPDLVILFGVAHSGAATPFVLTRKHFETPLGILQTDQEAVTQLEKACAWNPYATEIAHKMEHSIEFQALMLAYLYGTDVPIIPILCAFPSGNPGRMKQEEEDISSFLEVCAALANDKKRNVTVIAGADLSHVGKHFGDDIDISEEVIAKVKKHDLADLEQVTAGNAENFFNAVMADGNERHICGLGCIYATLTTLQGHVASGKLLSYDCAPDPVDGIVSFASISLE
ncbi:MAG: AmmeMemoRadiSam system protein B, partial [Candidatus Hydrogenedentes bacterium]|nr:AmmeMemoRadiSam system protein B [Candidatus Hydrogenedentota bacterium]